MMKPLQNATFHPILACAAATAGRSISGMIFSKLHLKSKRVIKSTLAKIILTAFVFLTLLFKVQAAEVLDDSQSPRKQLNIKLEWANKGDLSALNKDEFFLLKAHLPKQIDGFNGSNGFSLGWNTTGFFAPGTVILGTRALIYDGLIESPLMIEFFTFTLKVDANCLTGKLRYVTIYEIELY